MKIDVNKIPEPKCPYCGETVYLNFDMRESEFNIDGDLEQVWSVHCENCGGDFYRYEKMMIVKSENVKCEEW